MLTFSGANASMYQAAFHHAAESGEHATVDLFLRSPKRVSVHFMTQSLLAATISGSLKTVLLLARAGANAEFDNASALMYAVRTGRTDLVLALLLGPNPPSPQSLDRALDAIFSDPSVNLNEKYLLCEVLLCCGPRGNAVSEALFKATFLVNEEMIH
jgi:hypothetical protein